MLLSAAGSCKMDRMIRDRDTAARGRFRLLTRLAGLCLLLLGACESTPAPPAAPAASESASAKLLSRLAAADAADGSTDKVIHKCIGCSLHMDGDPAFAATAHGYEAHLCSEQCLYRFERDPDRVILQMQPPE